MVIKYAGLVIYQTVCPTVEFVSVGKKAVPNLSTTPHRQTVVLNLIKLLYHYYDKILSN
ncbi:MAG: hypothetical protein BWZ11_00176 [Bacteroidetes bacterium ADurb.BinA395]|mgnify:CR=1 FL=1|jgi:hypothetical protein|nr:MAG: hypothetical protein BWZ11_00176 [Bacteroidetes bacterium ADurb.BinA395]